jgi:hypothetical protein
MPNSPNWPAPCALGVQILNECKRLLTEVRAVITRRITEASRIRLRLASGWKVGVRVFPQGEEVLVAASARKRAASGNISTILDVSMAKPLLLESIPREGT